MTLRTIPTAFPVLREADFFLFKRASSTKILAMVQAANWLWANMVRLYAFNAYEGHGYYRSADAADPAANDPVHVPPISAGASPVLFASFLVPPNWGPSSTVRITGRNIFTKNSASPSGKMIAGVYDLSGAYLGVVGSATWTTTGTHDWTIDLKIPQDRPVHVKVWSAPTLSFGNFATTPPSNPDKDQLTFLTARYLEGVAGDLPSGDTPQTTWQPIAHDYIVAGESESLNVALLRTICRNLVHLYTQRPPMVLGSYFLEPYANTNAFTEVGRYVVRLAPHVTAVKGKLYVNCTHGGAGNEVRILIGGVVQQTFTALPTGVQTLALLSLTGLTGGTDQTITIEAKSTAAGVDWGTEVLGVYLWEEDVTLSLPAGSTIPASYTPIDEALLAVDAIELESVISTLVKNVTWLMANRTKNLISDWRHRAYKNEGQMIAAPNDIAEGGNWSRGYSVTGAAPNGYPGHPRNITVFPNTVADKEGSTDPTDKDGQGMFSPTIPGWPFLGGFTNDLIWPATASQQWLRHGRRLQRFVTDGPASYAPISSVAGALCRGWLRLRRARPQIVSAFHTGGATTTPLGGPAPEEGGFVGVGYALLAAEGSGTALGQWRVTGLPGRYDFWHDWYGPDFAKHSDFAIGVIRGYMRRSDVGYYNTEGALFELECCGALFMDAPLTRLELEAL